MPPGSSVALANGLSLSYAERGDPAGPAVLLLPGPTDSWLSYEPVLAHLPPAVRAIAASPRGHGDSDKPPSGYRVEDYAADVPLLLDALGVDRAVLAGHSGSCLVARRVALDHPDRVAGLVLEASPATLRGDAAFAAFVESIASLDDPVDADFVRSFVAGTSSADIAPDLVDRLVAQALAVPARVWRETFGALLDYDDLDEIGRIDAALLVWGDADGVVGRGAQDELLRRLPAATLTTYRGVGHTPRWQEPSRFASDVAAFVAATRT